MNNSKIIVTKYNNAVSTILFCDNRAQMIFFDTLSQIKVGDIFVGRVENVKDDISAAFVTISEGINGYLPFSEIFPGSLLNRKYEGCLKQGDLVAVTITKSKLKTKSYSLSMKLSLTGHFCVAEADDARVHYSGKLSKEAVNKIKEQLDGIYFKTGIIIRTNASATDINGIVNEAEALSDALFSITEEMKYRTAFSKLYSADFSFVERIKDIDKHAYTEIITDSADLYKALSCFENVRLYNDERVLLKSLYSFERAYDEATSKKVDLKGGGYLIIEQTEAFTSIDVNSGKFDKKATKDQMALTVNKAAAFEICRQLRLRNLYGIILVDFINMIDNEAEFSVIDILKKELKKDSVKADFIDITKLGIFEITRQKKYPSLAEELREINN